MLALTWLIPALPFAGFLILVFAGGRLPRPAAAAVGCGAVGLSALATATVAAAFLHSPPPGDAFRQVLWTWMRVGDFQPAIGFHVDALSLLMAAVVTGVGFLIHLYSAEYMEHESEGYARFFAYMNLFVGAMLVLVLADNLLLLYLGWEGVGLCSFLLIGFWYKDRANGTAASKAFIVTRVGDTAMALGLFLLVREFGTLDIQEVMGRASAAWPAGSPLAVLAAALLLGGALGKSGQLPLQVWLPDAMAGPTPVSALIHAATMVTAGVYLIARTHVLFALAPAVQAAVAAIGAATLLMAGCAALVQRDIKRVLAYSTISQIGYMFLALGVGAWSAAMFHFMTHAFFKALLFMAAGVVIVQLHHEQDMFRMGGLRRQLPLVFRTFLVGSASLAAIPFVTAGFYSKDLILWEVWASPQGGPVLWAAGVAGAFLTALYTTRMVALTFFGPPQAQATGRPGRRMALPLVALAALATVGGFVDLPETIGHFHPFTRFLQTALPAPQLAEAGHGVELTLLAVAEAVVLSGVAAGWFFFIRRRDLAERIAASPAGAAIHRFWFAGWGFDALYGFLFVRPYQALARVLKPDYLDLPFQALATFCQGLHLLFSLTQTGRVRWYAAGITGGVILLLGLAVFSWS